MLTALQPVNTRGFGACCVQRFSACCVLGTQRWFVEWTWDECTRAAAGWVASPQKFIFSQLWRQEVQNQGVCTMVSFEASLLGLQKAAFPVSSPSLPSEPGCRPPTKDASPVGKGPLWPHFNLPAIFGL